jgi:predicted amidohydrolase YtcJ
MQEAEGLISQAPLPCSARTKRVAIGGSVLAAVVLAAVVVAVLASRSSNVCGLYPSRSVLFVNADAFSFSGTMANVSTRQFSSFAVANGRFVPVREAVSFEVIDLEGATVLPGLIDAHAHLFALGESRLRPDITDLLTVEEIRTALESWIATNNVAPGSWLLGGRWHFGPNNFPTLWDLDASPLLKQYRIWLRRIDGHASWANGLTLQAVGVLPAQDPEGGLIVRFPNGSATGVFVDTAQLIVEAVMPKEAVDQSEKALEIALKECVEHGLTSVHTAGEPVRLIEVLKRFHDRGDLSVRVYAMLTGEGETFPPREECLSGFRDRLGCGRLTVRAVKFYADGSLGARGAAMLQPYTDDPGNYGLLKQTQTDLNEDVRFWGDCGFQLCTHAIGDAGVRVTLNAYEAWLQKSKVQDARLRVEHAQVVNVTDFARFKTLNVAASMQPVHCISDISFSEERVGPVRIRGAYAWETFVNESVPLFFGSDFPVQRVNPFFGIAAAVTRQNAGGFPAAGWYPEQRVSLEQALFGFTQGAAWGAFQENVIGSIEIGKYADFVVLPKGWVDKVTADPLLLWVTTVAQTWIGGARVY